LLKNKWDVYNHQGRKEMIEEKVREGGDNINYYFFETTLELAQNKIRLPLGVNKKESSSPSFPKTAT